MKKYEKPTLEVVQIRVKEDIANTGKGNVTAYNVDGNLVGMGISPFGVDPS
ncbi:MAG: hypothetical protein M0R40_00865 [Firmicutes bacterium]|nr:hypothetical protein [Bacillota bacterium]